MKKHQTWFSSEQINFIHIKTLKFHHIFICANTDVLHNSLRILVEFSSKKYCICTTESFQTTSLFENFTALQILF